jgi:hypothetical protein
MISSIWTFTRRSLRGTLPLLLLFLMVALPAAVALHSGQGPALASQLFQSPVSPVQPTAAPPAQPTAAPPARVPVQPQPTQPPAKPKPEKVLPPTGPPPAAQPAQAEPTAVPPVPPTQAPAQQRQPVPPTQPPAAVVPTSPPPTTAPAAEQATPVPPPPLVPGEETQPGSGSGEVIIDSGLLIDSILVYVSYAWLCCGILLFILIPIVFVGLYVWGAQRRKNANGFE